jgi:GNAT superfamily N-acetyltransferase
VTESGPETYVEPARSYASLWPVGLFFAVGIALDAGLNAGGLVAHLPGWAIAMALVGGVYALMIYAVRSQKSLRLTADELRVGDEAIGRGEIAAVARGIDDPELPVLGWPNGPPRGLRGVTVRLTDGRDVAVPTRFPDRLLGALDVPAARGLPREQSVRAAARSEFALLPEIDARAEVVFRTAGYQLPALALDPGELARAAAVFVAGRPPVGFVQLEEVDGLAYIVELAVIPKWMRQGIGTALLERACEWARGRGYPAIALTTYADVPWNAPYYARRGFVEITDFGAGLQAERERERELGLDEVGRRIVMRRELA